MKKTILTIVLTAVCASALTAGIFYIGNSDSKPEAASRPITTTEAVITSPAATEPTTAIPETTVQTTAPQTTTSTTAAPVVTTTAPPQTKAPTTTKAAEKKEITTTEAPTTSKAVAEDRISVEKALAIALKHSGLSASDVREKEIDLDRENGVTVYDVSFEKNGIDYEYIINAQTGKILYSEKETPKQIATTSNSSGSENKISAEKAESIALGHAGFSASDVREKEIELEKEKGVTVYDVSFKKDGIDYEYIIDAQSGELLHSHTERD